MPNIQFRKYSLQIRTICHIFPDFFLCRLLSNSLILLYNNFNRVPDRERARLGGSSYEEYSDPFQNVLISSILMCVS